MRETISYFVERGGVKIWLAQDEEPLPTDKVIATRRMIIAADGKTLFKGETEIAPAIWTDEAIENYTEGEIPPEVEEIETEEKELKNDNE